MIIEVPPLTPIPRQRAPHPSGYQLAKAKNAKLLTLINAISDRLEKAGPWPECGEQVVHIRGLIQEWRNNG